MKTVDAMLVLLKPEVLGLLSAEKHAMYRVILELIWTTGARISEMLALTSAFFLDDGYPQAGRRAPIQTQSAALA